MPRRTSLPRKKPRELIDATTEGRKPVPENFTHSFRAIDSAYERRIKATDETSAEKLERIQRMEAMDSGDEDW